MIVNDTTYNDKTPRTVIDILEANRRSVLGARRLRLEYGDGETGRAWGDGETGRIGRSMGPIKIPIILHNRRSLGGGGILDHCIVRISETTGIKAVLWQHPAYHKAPEEAR